MECDGAGAVGAGRAVDHHSDPSHLLHLPTDKFDGSAASGFAIPPRLTSRGVWELVQKPTLVVHGGAWDIPDDAVEAHERGVSNALCAGWQVIEEGGSAVDAVEEAVVVLEDDETFDAGRGSFLTRDGHVQMDAMIMDGKTLRAGGVGCVERVRNAVRLSRLVLDESPHVYFVGDGAERFAEEHGMSLIDNKELVIPREVERLK